MSNHITTKMIPSCLAWKDGAWQFTEIIPTDSNYIRYPKMLFDNNKAVSEKLRSDMAAIQGSALDLLEAKRIMSRSLVTWVANQGFENGKDRLIFTFPGHEDGPKEKGYFRTILSEEVRRKFEGHVNTQMAHSESWSLWVLGNQIINDSSNSAASVRLIIDIGAQSVELASITGTTNATFKRNNQVEHCSVHHTGTSALDQNLFGYVCKEKGISATWNTETQVSIENAREALFASQRKSLYTDISGGSLDNIRISTLDYEKASEFYNHECPIPIGKMLQQQTSSFIQNYFNYINDKQKDHFPISSILLAGGGSHMAPAFMPALSAAFKYNEGIAAKKPTVLWTHNSQSTIDTMRYSCCLGMAAIHLLYRDKREVGNKREVGKDHRVFCLDFGSSYIKLMTVAPQFTIEQLRSSLGDPMDISGHVENIIKDNARATSEEPTVDTPSNDDIFLRKEFPDARTDFDSIIHSIADAILMESKSAEDTNTVLEHNLSHDLDTLAHVSACTGHRSLLLLLGNPGCGKSESLRRLGRFDKHIQVHEITVRSSWEEPESFLGYRNPLRPEEFVPSCFLDAVNVASKDHINQIDRIHLVVLDEIDNATDHFLCDYLQIVDPSPDAVTNKKTLRLASSLSPCNISGKPIPSTIAIPCNLVVAATLNFNEDKRSNVSQRLLSRSILWSSNKMNGSKDSSLSGVPYPIKYGKYKNDNRNHLSDIDTEFDPKNKKISSVYFELGDDRTLSICKNVYKAHLDILRYLYSTNQFIQADAPDLNKTIAILYRIAFSRSLRYLSGQLSKSADHKTDPIMKIIKDHSAIFNTGLEQHKKDELGYPIEETVETQRNLSFGFWHHVNQ